MGRGILKDKNKMKKAYLSQAVRYIEQLEKENSTLKSDPANFVVQYKELHAQNHRLSVLAACLLQKLGQEVTVTKDEMDAFRGNRINIKWELPEGVERPEDAASYVFSYELVPQAEPSLEIAPTEVPA